MGAGEFFRQKYDGGSKKEQKSVIKLLLSKELGTDLVVEAFGRAIKEPKFAEKLLRSESSMQFLADAMKQELKDTKFAEFVYEVLADVNYSDHIKNEAYKNYKKDGGAPLYGLSNQVMTTKRDEPAVSNINNATKRKKQGGSSINKATKHENHVKFVK
jgi:hypothetical protein